MLIRKDEIGVFVFDFDGTLIDSAPGILEAFSAAMNDAGIVSCVPLDSNLIGPPLAETLMRISGSSDAALIRLLTEKFKHHYDSAGVASTHAYPGVETMLERFMETGVPMHVSTNKRLSVTRAIIEKLGWQDRFASVYALDMVEPRLPGKAQLLSKQIGEQGIDSARTCYVGDKLEDGHAADANGLAFFYASWGYGGLERGQMDARWRWLNHPADFL
ncbi:MAG: HAD family hydrolase [Sulfuricella denitrificans]|nr:HAD family hydrolase [Sulfuricella denitrificans]